MARRRRRYRGPRPYARMGCLGPPVGCSGCLIVLVAAVAVVVALLRRRAPLTGDRGPNLVS